MAEMTARGKRLSLFNYDVVVVAIGDRVTFARGGYYGTAHSWTEKGVMVVLDPECYFPCRENYRVLALEAGDGDLCAVVSQKGD